MKELKGEINSEDARCFNCLHDKLKAYCLAIDFIDTVALNNLRATLDENQLSQVYDTDKLSALWEKLTTKQVGMELGYSM